MGLAGFLHRSRARSAAEKIALLRWRQATAVNAAKTPAGPGRHHPIAELSGQAVPGGGNSNGSGDSNGNGHGSELFGSDSSPSRAGATAAAVQRVNNGADGDGGRVAASEQEVGAYPLLLREQLAAAQAAAAMARGETEALKSQHAEVLQESRCESASEDDHGVLAGLAGSGGVILSGNTCVTPRELHEALTLRASTCDGSIVGFSFFAEAKVSCVCVWV